MNLTRDRIRSFGWAVVLTICLALTAGLTLRVNAVKSQVRDEESRIVNLRQEILFLETEFQTRSNQQQLKALNDVEFGYSAPRAEQYIEGERQLAALGQPRLPNAPAPIRVASNVSPANAGANQAETFMSMVSPIDGIVAEGGAAKTAAPAQTTAEGPVKSDDAPVPGEGRKQLVRIQLSEAAGQ